MFHTWDLNEEVGIQMTNFSQFKVAAIQAAPRYFDPTASIIKACRFIQKAGEQDAALVAFGECWLPGYPFFVWGEYAPNDVIVPEYLANAVEIPSATTDELCKAARQANTEYWVDGIRYETCGISNNSVHINCEIFLDSTLQSHL